ncbi:replication factor A protein [Trifolium repens]|nr:replication factor A protein [Trifolium repens]
MNNTPDCTMIKDITTNSHNVSCHVRVVRKWLAVNPKDHQTVFSMECVLLDSQGHKIQSTMRHQLIYLFKDQLQEGKVYDLIGLGVIPNNKGEYRATRHPCKLVWEKNTKVENKSDSSVPPDVLTFTDPRDVFDDTYDINYLCHLTGILCTIGVERSFGQGKNKGKLNYVELDNNGYRFKITLFGSEVDELNSFITSGNATNAVVVVLFAKVRIWNGSRNLNTSLGSSQESVFIILAEIKSIDDRVWWYQSCKTHNIKVSPDADEYYCNKCKMHVSDVVPRYYLKLHVEDETRSATFVMFDKDAYILLNKTCAELVNSVKKSPNPQVLPKELTNLTSRTYLFKIACDLAIGTKFEPSYKVKTVTDDHNLIEQWKELGKSKIISPSGSEVAVTCVDVKSQITSDITGQDLMTKFDETEAAVEKVNVSAPIEVIDLCSHKTDGVAVKRPCPDGVDLPTTKYIKTNIKIEKE